MIYFHSFRNPGLIVDIVQDIRNLNELSRKSKKAGMVILGGGVCKHQIANAMLIVRASSVNLADLCVTEISDSGTARTTRCILYAAVPRYPLHRALILYPEHRARIRWFRFRCSSRRGRLMGQDPSRVGIGEGLHNLFRRVKHALTYACRFLQMQLSCSHYL